MTTDRPKGIRRKDLRNCAQCNQGLLHDGQIVAYRVEVTQYIADPSAINRQAGLEMMLGGHAYLAHVMGTDEEFLKGVSKSDSLLCQNCFMSVHAAEAWESGLKQSSLG